MEAASPGASTWDGSVLWNASSAKCGEPAAYGRICPRRAPSAVGRPRAARPRLDKVARAAVAAAVSRAAVTMTVPIGVRVCGVGFTGPVFQSRSIQ